MEFAGLLRNGILYGTVEKTSEIVSESNNSEELENQGQEKQKAPIKSNTNQGYTDLPPLPSGIVVSFPEDLAPFASLGRFSEGLNLLEEKANGS